MGDFAKVLKWSMLAVITMVAFIGLTLNIYFFYLKRNLPVIASLRDYRPPVITTVHSDDGRKIGEFYKERRTLVSLEEIPKVVIDAFIAAEDARFYKHKGIDFFSVFRAMIKNIKAGTIVQGGSTITQQVTKSFFLTPERSFTRKAKEAILASRIDKKFTKSEILYLYLNQIYFGHGAYGVQAASENYFGKNVENLNLAEAAILAGLPQAPSNYSPFRFPERAQNRQLYVLKRMEAEGYITQTQKEEAKNTELDIKPRRNWYQEKVPCYTEHVRRYVEKKYGKELLYKGGLKIYTAVNIEMQKAARFQVVKGLREIDKRQGFRGPIKNLVLEEIEAFSREVEDELEKDPLVEGKIVKGVVIGVDNTDKKVTVRIGNSQGIINISDMKWARKPDIDVAYYEAKIKYPGDALGLGDVILVKIKGKLEKKEDDTKDENLWELSLEQEPEVQSALLCVEAKTGYVKVMVGGRDFKNSQFNRAVQSRRQPGSAFKPVIYAAAIDKGYTPATIIIDSPIIIEDQEHDFTWKPRNYGQKFYGPTLFRTALAKSRNVVTIKILRDIGIDYAIEYSRRLGIASHLSRNLSIALGSSGITLLETVSSYSVFTNLGDLVEPIFITKIVDRFGNVIEENFPQRTRVIEKSTAYLMTSLLQSVVQNGTGYRVKKLKRPVAGKTGTTNNLFDAWFVGYTPDYVAGVWVGYDGKRSIGKGETGSRAASPIWLGFMKKILADKPIKVFQVPEGVVFSKIDAKSGLLPSADSEKTIFECFKEGTIPTEHTKKPEIIIEKEDFFKLDM
jgi:penicillin-binding protein 1A